MMVECLVVFCAISQSIKNFVFHSSIDFDSILVDSNRIFCDDNLKLGATDRFLEICEGSGLAKQFVDSAPSGQFGSMTYISRAISKVL